jgi:hypothetical protein
MHPSLESGVLYPFALIVYAVTTMIFRFAPFDNATIRDVKMALVSEVLASSLLQFVARSVRSSTPRCTDIFKGNRPNAHHRKDWARCRRSGHEELVCNKAYSSR